MESKILILTIKRFFQVSGEPMPETKWFLGKREVKSGGDTKVQHSDYNTKITCKAARRGDSGRYAITAENVNGKDVAEVEVIVLDVPSPPGGPLKVIFIVHNNKEKLQNICQTKFKYIFKIFSTSC